MADDSSLTLVASPLMLAAWDWCLDAPSHERMQAIAALYQACDRNDLMHMRLLALLKTIEHHGFETGAVRQIVCDMSTKNDYSTTTNVHAKQAQVAVASHGSTATASYASQQLGHPEFSGEALKAEVAELFALVAERLEALEESDRPAAMEAVTALRGVNFATAKSEQDALQMLEDLWGDAMKNRYSAFDKIVSAIGKHAGPLVMSLLKRGVTGA